MSEYTQTTAAAPPHSDEAERSVLGAMMKDANVVSMVMEQLAPDDFYAPAHSALFESMASLYKDQHQPVDMVTVTGELQRRGTLQGIGGLSYLTQLLGAVPSTANARAYVDIVLDKSTRRRLMRASADITQSCMGQDTLTEVLGHAEKSIFDIVMRRGGGESLVPMRDALTLAYAQIEELSRLKGEVSGVPSGFIDLDGTLTGMHGGELLLVGARPSMGKTSFAINVAQNAARKGNTVAVFSLEMPREQIAMRVLCSEARVNMQSVRKGTLTSPDWERLADALTPVANMPIYIDDTAGITPSQLRSRSRRLMMEHGLNMIVIDYLQLMSSDGRSENRQIEVSEISRRLKAIALELRVPLIACAQLSRANTQRTNKRPMLSDLRDSGSIEQDADVVMFLHRESYYDDTVEEKDVAEVIVAKQRNGPLNTVKLRWLEDYTTFANYAGAPQNA